MYLHTLSLCALANSSSSARFRFSKGRGWVCVEISPSGFLLDKNIFQIFRKRMEGYGHLINCKSVSGMSLPVLIAARKSELLSWDFCVVPTT